MGQNKDFDAQFASNLEEMKDAVWKWLFVEECLKSQGYEVIDFDLDNGLVTVKKEDEPTQTLLPHEVAIMLWFYPGWTEQCGQPKSCTFGERGLGCRKAFSAREMIHVTKGEHEGFWCKDCAREVLGIVSGV